MDSIIDVDWDYLLEERRKLEEEADRMSVSGTSFSASTMRGLGTTSGKAIMIVGELALRAGERVGMEMKLRRDNFRLRRDNDRIPRRLLDNILEYQRLRIYPDSIRRQAWSMLDNILKRGNMHICHQIVDIMLRWPQNEVYLLLRQLYTRALSNWALDFTTEGMNTALVTNNPHETQILTESFLQILLEFKERDSITFRAVFDMQDFVILQTALLPQDGYTYVTSTQNDPPKKTIGVIGDSLGTTTAMIQSFITGRSRASNVMDSPVEIVYESAVAVDGSTVDVAIYNTSVFSEYQAMRASIYHLFNVVLVIIAIDDPDKFHSSWSAWHDEITRCCEEATPIILVGCKFNMQVADEATQTAISYLDGKEATKSMHAEDYMECSLDDMEDIHKVFLAAARLCVASNRRAILTYDSRNSPNKTALFHLQQIVDSYAD